LPSFDDAVTELDSAAEIQALNAEYKAMEAQISNTMEDSAYDPPLQDTNESEDYWMGHAAYATSTTVQKLNQTYNDRGAYN